jgi:RNA polymerase sigma-70 factor (ECF subfamily)
MMSEKRFQEAGEIIANGPEPSTGSLPLELGESEQIRLAAKDLAHFRPLYEKWMPPVYRYLYHRVGGVQEAEELTAQVFLAVCEKLPAYRHRGHFAAWLFSIARRKTAEYFRKRLRFDSLEVVDIADPEPDPFTQAADGDEIRRLRELIRALPEKDQEYIRLRFMAGLTYGEMAVLFKKRKDAVRKYLSRLLARLQNQLEERDERAFPTRL